MSLTLKTETHEFRVQPGPKRGYWASYQALNPKTGEPWQRTYTLRDGATLDGGWYFETVAAAETACKAKARAFAGGRRA